MEREILRAWKTSGFVTAKIASMGYLDGKTATRVIDASGLAVAPRFH
jgi:hypothetical protein